MQVMQVVQVELTQDQMMVAEVVVVQEVQVYLLLLQQTHRHIQMVEQEKIFHLL